MLCLLSSGNSQEDISQRVERWYKVFLMIDFGSYGSGVIISRGCVKFYPVALFKIQDGR